MSYKPCEHDYCHESTHYKSASNGYGKTKYVRLDVYYCRKCLDKEEKTQEEVLYSEDPSPIWFQH